MKEIDYEKGLFEYLEEVIRENAFAKDNEEVKNLYTELKKITEMLPTIEKLEKIRKIVADFDQKYESLNELSYYFDPVYVRIKREIHKEKVKKLREQNKRKRDESSGRF